MYMYVCIYVLCMYVCMHIYKYISLHVCMYVYIWQQCLGFIPDISAKTQDKTKIYGLRH